jgi:hypothetical protein
MVLQAKDEEQKAKSFLDLCVNLQIMRLLNWIA